MVEHWLEASGVVVSESTPSTKFISWVCSSIVSSIRLLIERLWIRVPPDPPFFSFWGLAQLAERCFCTAKVRVSTPYPPPFFIFCPHRRTGISTGLRIQASAWWFESTWGHHFLYSCGLMDRALGYGLRDGGSIPPRSAIF